MAHPFHIFFILIPCHLLLIRESSIFAVVCFISTQGVVYQLDVALESVDTQRSGLVFIYDMSDSKYANFDYDLSQKILTLLKVIIIHFPLLSSFLWDPRVIGEFNILVVVFMATLIMLHFLPFSELCAQSHSVTGEPMSPWQLNI